MQYDLVLEGGGAKSIIFAGALQEFEARGHTFGRLLGTSAGGITAAMLACGYTSQEALALLYDTQAQRITFADALITETDLSPADLRCGILRTLLRLHNFPTIPDILEDPIETLLFELLSQRRELRPLLSFIERGYWYSDQGFLTWLQQLLDSGAFQGKPRRFSEMTLKEFFRATNVELSLLASNVTTAHILILNHRTAPDCPLLWALRMTSGIPLVWSEVIWQPTWGLYLQSNITGHHIVDGELFSSFPIELFFSDLPEVTELLGEKQASHVAGLLLDETESVPTVPRVNEPGAVDFEQLPAIRLLGDLFGAVLRARDKLTIETISRHIIRLPVKGYHLLEFRLSQARFKALLLAGRQAAQNYFAQQADDPTQQAGDLGYLVSPSALQYINHSAKQQLSHNGVINIHINTAGGAYIRGNVYTGDGNFIGRDMNEAVPSSTVIPGGGENSPTLNQTP